MEIYRITGRGLIRCPFKASRVLDLLPKGQWTVEHGPGPPNYCSIKGLHRTVLLTFLDMACWISYMHTVQSANIAHLYEHIIERQRAWLLGAASPDCLSPPRLYTLTGGGGEDGRQIWDEKKGGNERRGVVQSNTEYSANLTSLFIFSLKSSSHLVSLRTLERSHKGEKTGFYGNFPTFMRPLPPSMRMFVSLVRKITKNGY